MSLTAYRDPVGIPTIGYGETRGVHMGMTITAQQAEQWLQDRVRRDFAPGVITALTRGPRQRQVDAMVSLAYNVGVGAFSGSTLVRKFNAGDIAGAADEFLRWDKAGGQSMKGLRRRRAAERALFLGSTLAESIAIGDAYA